MRTLPTLALSLAPAAIAGFLALCPHADAAPSREVTVDDRDYPVCEQEDCSDQPGQVGVWFDPDTGEAWLSLGEDRSVHIDQTVKSGAGGEYVPGTDPLDVFAPR